MQTLFSTGSAHPRQSFRRWQEVICERIIPVELTSLGDAPFAGTVEAVNVDFLPISRVTQSAIRTESTPNTIRRNEKQDTVSVVIVLDGAVTSAQNDREAVQRRGDLTLLDRSRPVVMSTRTDGRTLLIEVPRARVEGMLGSPRLYSALTVGVGQASASLVITFFTELLRIQGQLDPATAGRMASIGVDLIVASLAERLAREVPKPMQGTLVVQRAKAYVEANLGDQTLDPPQLAAAVGVSLRHLQQLFHERGRHIADWIWQRRLDTAAQRLADVGQVHLSIGLIAYGCGFASQAHFARRFKEKFGATPSEYRAASCRT